MNYMIGKCLMFSFYLHKQFSFFFFVLDEVGGVSKNAMLCLAGGCYTHGKKEEI